MPPGPDITVETAAPTPDVARLTEHLFREESGKLVAVLTGIFGIHNLQLAEDVVQDALAKALRIWPYYGIPKNPSAWLMQVSRNMALDVIRRETWFREKQETIISELESRSALSGTDPLRIGESDEKEISDDRLRLLFVCCHPHLAQEVQVALALKTLCGFSTLEISRAFLTTEASIAKRLTRGKQRLREADIPFAIPTGEDLAARLTAVLQTIYLLFNEGYKASAGDRLIREDLCFEAIRLLTFLVRHPLGNQPSAHALLSLMLLTAARFETRMDDAGALLRLEEQDRSKWNRELITRGMMHLRSASVGDVVTEYHLQAGIAACHCMARDFASTDWAQILALYDRLVDLDDSPVVALNRAIAVAHVHGAGAGVKAIYAIPHCDKLESYYLLYAVLGELETRRRNTEAAERHFEKALKLAETSSEQDFLHKQLAAVRADSKGQRESP